MSVCVSHRATFRLLEHLRVWFYSAIEPLAPAQLWRYRSGDILTRSIADIETLESFYVRVLVPPLAAALGIAFACAILAAFAWSLALALFFFLLLAGVVVPVTVRRIGKETAAEIIAVRSRLNAMLVDEVQGMPDLLVYDTTDRVHADVLRCGGELAGLQQKMALLRGGSNAITVMLTGAAALATLALAIPLITSGDVEPVYLAVLPLTAIAAFEAIQPLAPALQQLEANHAAGQRIFELIDSPPEVLDPIKPAGTPGDLGIELRDLTFRYTEFDPPALDGVTFNLPESQRVAIVGESGSGKSTIVNLLLRFWDFRAGDIYLGGISLRDYRANDVRDLISVVPQDAHLFNASIRNNLLLADPDATEERIVEACKIALLHDFIQSLPEGYDTQVGETGLLLSGGECQRLAIARAVLKNAPIVVLDEPTANLDPETERKLMQSLEPFLAGKTVLIISHRPVVCEHVDQLVRLDKGHLIQDIRATIQ